MIQPVTTMHRPGNSPAVRICDMTDAHLLCTLKRTFHAHYSVGYLLEARRRGLVGESPTSVDIIEAIERVKR
jgi:hypothetical protein